jgi:hypothetical protein
MVLKGKSEENKESKNGIRRYVLSNYVNGAFFKKSE